NSGWIGPYDSGQEGSAQKSWSATGTYAIRAKAKDINGAQSSWSTSIMMTIMTDRPPATPTITGPAEGEPGNLYLYTVTTTDPDGDMVFYYVDWGDGQTSEWVGPYNSGATASVTHEWAEEGAYTVQAKAKDTYGVERGWATLDVTMPVSVQKHQATQLQTFLQHITQLLENLGLRLSKE
ncbi:MAG TPA: hypothetical protein HA258_03435, partial [Thermoplasmata archaeon]|nr:hypothetical protein [Thermoplasmata archaeon]